VNAPDAVVGETLGELLTIPDFVVENGATDSGVLEVAVSQPGHSSEPSFRVDSIEGVSAEMGSDFGT